MKCKSCGKPKSRHNKYQQEECKYVRKYIRDTQVGPFPVQFITVDPVVFYGDTVLLVRRKNHPGKGKLALPGGFANPDEFLLDAAMRECKEETGLVLSKDWLVTRDVFDDPKRCLGVRIVTHAFGFDVPIGQLFSPKAADDASWCGLLPIREALDSWLHDDHREIIQQTFNKIGRTKL